MDGLEAATVAAFRRDGAVLLRGVLDAGWIETLRAGLERNLAEPGPFARHYTPAGGSGAFRGDYCNWQRIPEYRAFMERSPAAGLAAALMESTSARVFHEHILVKEPSTAERTPWHHDQPYYCVEGRQTVSLWIPLDPVARATCVEFVAGSHAWGRRFRPTKFTGNSYERGQEDGLEPTPPIDEQRERYRILGWDLEPGDCIAFDFLTLHGAPGNAAPDRRRRAFAARFLGDDVVYAERAGEVSPPFPEIVGRLAEGAALPETLFPIVWPR
ncbi:MAG: phytanoyl-CoA dioxygenase family protein [Tistlia sp.]|uniref:phytanoyl-CoA dioxygenase family protein n=1 Tax=Tistlia sp. TaxID=3057121 RepID=UPI0034A150D5